MNTVCLGRTELMYNYNVFILTEKGTGDNRAGLKKLNTRKQHDRTAMEPKRECSNEEIEWLRNTP